MGRKFRIQDSESCDSSPFGLLDSGFLFLSPRSPVTISSMVSDPHPAAKRKARVLLITPPLLQPNAPYPATAVLAGFLQAHGFRAAQADPATRAARIAAGLRRAGEFRWERAVAELEALYRKVAGCSDGRTISREGCPP